MALAELSSRVENQNKTCHDYIKILKSKNGLGCKSLNRQRWMLPEIIPRRKFRIKTISQ